MSRSPLRDEQPRTAGTTAATIAAGGEERSPLLREICIAAAALALLYGATRFLFVLPCVGIAVIAIAMAWQISSFLGERSALHGRLMADAVAVEGSFARRMLTRHFLTRNWHGLVALLASIALLAWLKTLSPIQWILLAGDALLLPLLAQGARACLARQIKSPFLSAIARNSVLIINIALLGTAFMLVELWTGSPDTRQLSVSEAFASGQARFDGTVTCQPTIIFCGLIEGLGSVFRHFAQTTLPGLPETSQRIAGWVIVLFGAGIAGIAFTMLMLGIMLPGRSLAKLENRRPQALVTTILAATAIAIHFLYGPLSPWRSEGPGTATEPVVARADPCAAKPQLARVAHARLVANMEATRAQSALSAASSLRLGVRSMTAAAEARIDDYLDWYYSVPGANSRLAAALVANGSETMRDDLLARFFPGGLEPALGGLAEQAAAGARHRFQSFARQAAASIGASLHTEPCLRALVSASRLASLEQDLARSAGATLVAGASGRQARKWAISRNGQRLAAAAGARGTARALAAQGGRAAAGRAATGTAILACAPTGPGALFCGAVAAIGGWLASDYLMIKAEEQIYRAEHKAELHAALRDLELLLHAQLAESHRILLQRFAAETQTNINRLFVPMRDGI